MMYYGQQRPGDWDRRGPDRDLSRQDRRALDELIEDERELARDYRQAAQRTQNRQLAQLWRGYADEAQRRANIQQDILRRGGWGSPGGGRPGGWPGGGWQGGWQGGGWGAGPGWGSPGTP